MRIAKIVVVIAISALLSACGPLRPSFETPDVTVTAFRSVPSSGIVPTFEIDLRVTNPNAVALALDGVAYSISLADRKLVTGVSNELPSIPAYGQGDVTLSATADLFSGARIIADLLQTGRRDVDYAFEATLDLAGLYPSLRVRDSGTIPLQPSR